ncbi:unnamed protein product [Boreogadus saida]
MDFSAVGAISKEAPEESSSTHRKVLPSRLTEEVQNIIRKMKPSTCALDPLPTSLLQGQIWHPDPRCLQLWVWLLQGPTRC